MRKFLITFLAVLCCGLTIAAFGCKDDGKTNAPKEYTVEFTPTENLEYVCEQLEDGGTTIKVKSGTVVSFTVEVPYLYVVPTIYSNGNVITATSGVYSVKVTSDITITTGVVRRGSPTYTGDGSDNSPINIATPEDYFYIADMINAGDPAFISAYYTLENDIDFGGEEIPVIGDGSTATSYFMGNFNGKGHTISNFKIKTNGAYYVGLFGYLVSSGQGDDTGVIANLNIDNFDIEAQAGDMGTVFAGSLVGYSMASSVIACSATNGSIIVNGSTENAVFSYVGGAVGVQTSATIITGDGIQYFPATTGYVYTDVYVNGVSGGILATGGVVGYVISENERAISSVINCYSEGDVSGGIYSGGVVGGLSDYSSMVNCYSLSVVYAYSRYRDNEIYSHSYAGGLAGYLGNNAVITDSFTKSEVSGGAATPGAAYVHTGDLVGGKAEATAIADKGILFNCYSGSQVGTTTDFFKNTLCWQECDWVFENGSYPVINPSESQENNFTVTFDYSGKVVDSKSSRNLDISLSEDFYSPLFYHYGEEFGDIVRSDDGETSYGYFFDVDLTQKVPYGFIPTRDITLYTGFKDYSEVAGVYYLVPHNSKREIKLTLRTDGSYSYKDGVVHTYIDPVDNEEKVTDEFTDFYTYDGVKLLFGNALFARLSNSVTISDDNSARPDLNYNFTKFAAKVVAGGLEIYDDNFFAEATPLKANRNVLSGEWYRGTDKYIFYTDNTGTLNGTTNFTYTLTGGVLTINAGGSPTQLNVSDLSKYDSFKGVWEIASNISRIYEFDGINKWTYTVKGVVKDSGTYTVSQGVATLKAGLTAEIDASGLLLVKKDGNNEYFAKENSFSGTWVDFENNVIIYIDGFGSSLAGNALIKIGGATSELTYILDGFFDVDGNKHITLLNGYTLFGYLTINEDGTLSGTFFSVNTAEYLSGYNFYLLDTLEGEWVGEGTIGGVNIDSLEFNGLGIHGDGSVVLNGADGVEYVLNAYFDGIFGEYTVSFDDENNWIVISSGTETAYLYRKDEIGSYVLIGIDEEDGFAEDEFMLTFNGGGDLSKGGKLTVTDASGNEIAVLGYKNASGSIADLDLVIELYSEFRGTAKVGEITIEDYKFKFEYTGAVAGLPDLTLTIDNPYRGTWGVSDFNTNIVIDPLDLSNQTTGSFLDMGRTTFTYLPEYECFTVAYQVEGMTVATSLYLILLSEGNMVISSYNVLTYGDNLIYCALNDGLLGTWKKPENNQNTIRFDGMGDSLYTVGTARNASGEIFFYTRRFGQLYFWSSDGESAYTMELNGNKAGASMVYEKNSHNWIVFKDFGLSSGILEARDGSTEYEFYLTHVEVDGVRKSYTITKVNGDITELVIYENEEDTTGVRFRVNHAEKTIEQV